LNQHLRPRGRLFGPDPAMSQVTTMGSVIAIDASGNIVMDFNSIGMFRGARDGHGLRQIAMYRDTQ
jgi:isoaspartyl peptidase/L-asparaginase-like protein (Ntn-hydrolase superfamily)